MSKLNITSPVISYITEEVARQGHNLYTIDGIQRVGWMTEAWCYAIKQRDVYNFAKPNLNHAIEISKLVERYKNANGVRECMVYVANEPCPEPKHLNRMLVELFESIDNYEGDAIMFYKEFEKIHPFIDGNGRTGKIILNWLNKSLLEPIFPPSTLWGRKPITNP